MLEKALKLLDVEGVLQRDGSAFSLTEHSWTPDMGRAERVTQRRIEELAEIKRYVEHEGCLMEFLARALDDPAAAACGKCMNCSGHRQRRAAPAQLVQAAIEFLRQDTLELEPRKFWPRQLLPQLERDLPAGLERHERGASKVIIPERLRSEAGPMLCAFGDAGWGRQVAQDKYGSGRFHESLGNAAAGLILRRWRPPPKPELITTDPSPRP